MLFEVAKSGEQIPILYDINVYHHVYKYLIVYVLTAGTAF